MGAMAEADAPSRLSRNAFVSRFGGVFEHSPWIAEAVFDAGLTPAHDTAAGLHAAMAQVLRAAAPDRQMAVIHAHPDLAGKLAAAQLLTAESAQEQASAGLDRLTAEEKARFTALNAAYVARFGFVFIMAIRGRSTAEILAAFERRLAHDPAAERAEALAQIARIALLRLEQMLPGATPDPLNGARILARLDDLAAFTDVPGEITRLTLSPAHKAAAEQVARWFAAAGLAVHLDATGSVVGRRAGSVPGARALILGSHIDTVRDAGRFDGTLGVVLALAVAEHLSLEGRQLPFPLEVVAFADEEGVRFPSTLTSSRALAGCFDPAALEDADADGITRRAALAGFGVAPDAYAGCDRAATAAAYVEAHIEQGPVLEALGLPLGVVTAIAGASRGRVRVRGAAGHSGTLPMAMRHDALAAAAEMVLAVEQCGRSSPDLVATVGTLAVPAGAVNVVPGEVEFSLDVRSADDTRRLAAIAEIRARIAGIAAARGVEAGLEISYEQPAAPCDPGLQEGLAAAIGGLGKTAHRLLSGAGHDGLSFRGILPIGMLFVRSRNGSHNPREDARAEDLGLAAQALHAFVTRFSPGPD